MPWVRFDDQFPIHRKTAGLSDAAFRLHVGAIFWCARNLTDGFVQKTEVKQVQNGLKSTHRLAAELVLRGLWHLADEQCPSENCIAPVEGDGWIIHDYLEYQPSAVKVRIERAENARRQQEWRDRKSAARNAVTNSITNGVTNGVSNAPRNAAPSRPVPVLTKTSTSSATPSDGPTTKPRHAKSTEPLEPDAFARFWTIYPRRVAKGAAIKAWNRAIKTGTDAKTILDACEFYALERKGQDPNYTKHPATWLNAACWHDEPDPAYVPPVVAGVSEAGAMQPKSYQQVMADLEAGLD